MSSKTEVVIEPEVESPTVSVFLSLMCDQSDYRSATKKGLSQHKRIRQLISQVDGIDAYTKEGNTETVDSEVKRWIKPTARFSLCPVTTAIVAHVMSVNISQLMKDLVDISWTNMNYLICLITLVSHGLGIECNRSTDTMTMLTVTSL